MVKKDYYNKYGVDGFSNSIRFVIIRESGQKADDVNLTIYPLEDGRAKVKFSDGYLRQNEETTMPMSNVCNYVCAYLTTLDMDWEDGETKFKEVQIYAPMFPSLLIPIRKMKNCANHGIMMEMVEQTVANWKYLLNRYFPKESKKNNNHNQQTQSGTSSLSSSYCADYPKFDRDNLNHCC